jgi:hypothetical protein
MRRLLLLLVLFAACSKLLDLQDVTPPTCSDGRQDGSETDVDCGGSCEPCATGAACASGDDCTTRSCQGMVCKPTSCSDGVVNGDETDRDCGGACHRCDTGKACTLTQDCVSGVCQSNRCVAASCTDDLRNGDETDRDCGGSCAPCADGKDCGAAIDCTSDVCTANRCQPPSCTDDRRNGDETDRDCGGPCEPCADSQACRVAVDCVSGVCMNNRCQAPTCSDGTRNGTETDNDCGGGACVPCAPGKTCAVDRDCAAAGVCDSLHCRFAGSCAEILAHHPAVLSQDGAYSILPAGVTVPLNAFCDMTRDGGGWTLLLKSAGGTTLGYNDPAWTDTSLINPGDLTTQPNDAKYQGFLSLPVATLRGELDGFRYASQGFPGLTAAQIFAGGPAYVSGYPTFNTGAPGWSTQPNCQIFGVNTPFDWAKTRFGWSANQENDCLSNDTAIGLGLMNNGVFPRGAGYYCLSTECSAGNMSAGGNGLLWGR